jgi:hypothetical protein
MAIPTFVIREMIPVAPGELEPVERLSGPLTSEDFSALEGKTFQMPDGEFFTLGEPIVADEQKWRKLQKQRLRKDPEIKAKEAQYDLKRRADPVYKARAITNTKKFLEANHGYKRDWDSVDYHRPFVIFDSEGCRIKDAPPIVMYNETETEYARRVKEAAEKGRPKPERKCTEYPAHASFLWMAGYWQRTRPGTGIGPGESSLHHSGTKAHTKIIFRLNARIRPLFPRGKFYIG